MIWKITSHFLFIDTEELRLGNMQSKQSQTPDIQTSTAWHILQLDLGSNGFRITFSVLIADK